MKQSEFNEFMNNYLLDEYFTAMLTYAKKRETSSWATKAGTVEKAKENGYTDGSNPMGLITRVEVWAMLNSILEEVKK